jgi:hypothetical protein
MKNLPEDELPILEPDGHDDGEPMIRSWSPSIDPSSTAGLEE